MAVIIIPNQPIKFIKDGETFNQKNARLMWDRRQYCQLVKTTQTQQFQFRTTEVSGNNLVANGGFDTNLNGWTVFPVNTWSWQVGQAWSTGLAQVYSNSINQTVPIEANKTYKLTFDVDFAGFTGSQFATVLPTVGSLAAQGGAVAITSPGSYTTYWRSSSAITNQELYFTVVNDYFLTTFITLDNIRLYELSEAILTLEDCNGNYIEDVNDIERYEEYVTFTHNWENQTDGQCYKFCLYGTEDLSLDYLEDSFCLKDGRGRPLLDENGDCLSKY